ncbi:hypothetical protein KRR40_39425 [Niabella defluvii]|nr:hypothetical protein KRR40_39425 [Niabella sp. I65]
MPDTIVSNGDDGSMDQVIVTADPVQIEENIKKFITDYYRSRSNCSSLSAYFNDVVKQYYKKATYPLAI